MISSRVSKRYAKALFILGQEDGSFITYGKKLEEFRDFYTENPDFRNALSNTVYKLEERRNVLNYVLDKSGFSGVVKNFLNLLLEKNRVSIIKEISERYAAFTDEAMDITNAEIITARPLRYDTLQKLINSLKEMTSKDIRSKVIEDPDLIGGIVVKIGDMVMDGSVKAQLTGLKESFKRGGQTSWK
ncbi:MAG: ATP synthase F1 subunit delta [Desulfatiglans sp.]|jgi:F-type H+-transporting ATPase subunit delta|nr:ATP synthase F1 subunit delta [Desulfatiglans sp.]